MKILTVTETMQRLARALRKPCMMISYDIQNYEEITKAAPYINFRDHLQHIGDGQAVIVFDTAKEMAVAYNSTVGDDGPTKTNPYNGPTRVYALTCGPDGKLQNENT